MLIPAAAYIRVSDERQDEYSPDSQKKLIAKYAADHGYLVPEEFIFYDDGISAKTALKRDEFRRMIALAKEKDPPFRAILVWKFSRFARNQEESIVYKNMLRKNGVSVVSVSEPIPEDVYGGLIERVIEWMDEFYLIRLSEEVKRGMTEKASRGETMAPAPFGYVFNKTTKIYEPHPTEGPAVAEIFGAYASGESMKQLALRLNAAGFTSKRGNPLDNRAIDYILHNPVYVGKIRWSPEGRKASRREYDAEGVIVESGKHQPLIPEELWNEVQARLKEQKLRYARYQRKEPSDNMFSLKGLLRCSACGATLVRTATACPSLQCHNYARGSCTVSHSISIAKATRLVTAALESAVANALPVTPEKRTLQTGKILPDYPKLLSELAKKKERLSDAYLNGIYDLPTFAKLKSQIETEEARLCAERDAALAPPPSAEDQSAYREKLATVLTVLKDPSASEQMKNVALRSVLTSITYDRPSSTLHLHFYS